MKTPSEVHQFFRLRFGTKYISKTTKAICERRKEQNRPEVEISAVSKTMNGIVVNQAIREDMAAIANMKADEMWESEFDIITGLKKVA